MKKNLLSLIGVFFLTSCTLGPISIEYKKSTPVQTESGVFQTATGELVSLSGGSESGSTLTGEISLETGARITSIIPTISGELDIVSADDICILDLCIRKNKPYFPDGDTYIQIAVLTGVSMDHWEYLTNLPKKSAEGVFMTNTESSRIITIKKDASSGSLQEYEIMSARSTDLSKIQDNAFLVREVSGGCGGSSFKERFISTDGRSLSFDSLGKNYPKTFQAGSVSFQSYWTEDSISYLWRVIGRDGVEEIPEIFSASDDIGAKVLSYINGKKEFTQSYAIKYKEYPGIIFLYKSGLPSAERVVLLGNDTEWKSKNLDINGNLLDIELTKKILSYYEQSKDGNAPIITNRQVQKKGDANYDKITQDELTGSLMPVFRVKPLDTFGNYLLYTTDAYESVIVAELCKPLVYVYDTKSRDSSLQVHFPRGGAFTKIIPSFTSENTWDFRANAFSKIDVKDENTSSEYLYYSAKVPDYTYNQNGWQIYGRDIRAFFEEKLDVIGFNKNEKSDFIEYWIDQFDADAAYFISFKFDTDLDSYVSLHFKDKPVSQMRVLLEAYPLEASPNVRFLWPQVGTKFDPLLLKKFTRSGEFDVFEWGGTVQRRSGGTIHIH